MFRFFFYVVVCCNKIHNKDSSALCFLGEFASVLVAVGDERALPHTHPDPLCTHPPTHAVFTHTCTRP